MLLGYSRGFPSLKDSRDVTQLPQVEIQKMMNDQTKQVRKESSILFEHENLITKMAEKFPCWGSGATTKQPTFEYHVSHFSTSSCFDTVMVMRTCEWNILKPDSCDGSHCQGIAPSWMLRQLEAHGVVNFESQSSMCQKRIFWMTNFTCSVH